MTPDSHTGDTAAPDQTAYLLHRLRTVEGELDRERRRSRTLYNEGFRAGRNDWAELTARWRRAFEVMEDAARASKDGDWDRLGKILRSWVGRA